MYAPPNNELRLALTIKGLTQEETDAFLYFLQNLKPTSDPLRNSIQFPNAEMKKAFRNALTILARA